jgi:hypothetical protein
VQVTVGTPSTPTSYVNWQLENDLTDDNANQALTDGDSISYAGSEPDPPGYGSNGAVFNGTSDYLYVTKANIGNHLCRGTSTECTIIVGFTANTSDTGYLWAYYDPDDDGLAVQYNGTPRLITGYNSGDSYQFLSIPHSYGAASVVLGLSLDMTTKEYVYSSKEMGSGDFYDIDHNSNPLIGTLHDPRYGPDNRRKKRWGVKVYIFQRHNMVGRGAMTQPCRFPSCTMQWKTPHSLQVQT